LCPRGNLACLFERANGAVEGDDLEPRSMEGRGVAALPAPEFEDARPEMPEPGEIRKKPVAAFRRRLAS
jgi:hypothetical protein